LLAGGSGFLGAALRTRLEAQGHRVRNLTRRALSERGSSNGRGMPVAWAPDGETGPWASALTDTDIVINLAGENIAAKRWTARRKAALRDSRILATRSLVAAFHDANPRPRALISASGVGYYGPRGDERVTESDGPGDDFLANLCREWEREASAADRLTRVVTLRTGLVLAAHGGALKKMLLPFKLGGGATLGSGRQYMPWIHLDDWTAMVAWLASNEKAQGPFNVTAPQPETNARFTQALARSLHRPALLHAPAFALRLGLGELAEALLTGQRAVPARAEELGFRFAFRDLEGAFKALW
jgi:uncharacterized protein (TIGR01777 family)